MIGEKSAPMRGSRWRGLVDLLEGAIIKRRALAAAGSLSEAAFVTRFGSLADRATGSCLRGRAPAHEAPLPERREQAELALCRFPASGSCPPERLGNAVLLIHDGYGHTSDQDHSACVERATSAYLVDLVTQSHGTVCPSDRLPFDPNFGELLP